MVTGVPSGTGPNANTVNGDGNDLFERQCVGSAVQITFGQPVGRSFVEAVIVKIDEMDEVNEGTASERCGNVVMRQWRGTRCDLYLVDHMHQAG
uniref:Uncharacterized protein n=1 Tax=Parascaris univalens TaxID=6257 RepID=A0A915CFQ4_PARUN